jgi:hypothetical protein
MLVHRLVLRNIKNPRTRMAVMNSQERHFLDFLNNAKNKIVSLVKNEKNPPRETISDKFDHVIDQAIPSRGTGVGGFLMRTILKKVGRTIVKHAESTQLIINVMQEKIEDKLLMDKQAQRILGGNINLQLVSFAEVKQSQQIGGDSMVMELFVQTPTSSTGKLTALAQRKDDTVELLEIKYHANSNSGTNFVINCRPSRATIIDVPIRK